MKNARLLFFFLVFSFVGCQKLGKDHPLLNTPGLTAEAFVSLKTALKIATVFKQGSFIEPLNKKSSISSIKGSEVAGGTGVALPIDFSKRTISDSFTLLDSLSQPIIHVFNYVEGGFLLISAFKKEHPILAFSDKSSFAKNITKENNANAWIKHEAIRINRLEKLVYKDKDSLSIKSEWDSYAVQTNTPSLSSSVVTPNVSYCQPGYHWVTGKGCVANNCPNAYYWNGSSCVPNVPCSPTYYAGPFLRTLWDQGCGYNSNCPATSNSYFCNFSPTGCVPTAVAQVFKYWGQGYGTTRFNQRVYFDYSDNAMPLNSGSAEIARLMAQAGSYLQTQYGNSESSTSVYDDVIGNMFRLWGYANSAVWDGGGNLPNMWTEVKASRPFIFVGGDHCWVSDGVEAIPNTCYPDPNNVFNYNTYWHMNFGWGGYYNGYYAYGAISNGGDQTLDQNDKTIMRIHP